MWVRIAGSEAASHTFLQGGSRRLVDWLLSHPAGAQRELAAQPAHAAPV